MLGRSGALLSGEPGTHNHWPRVMDSGLATLRWRPGMTDLIVDRSTLMIGFIASLYWEFLFSA